tara:strand:+ start:4862 stop:6121 length:1260 start_codon:yes stop_codon:yes gene_type:complete
MSEEKLVEKFDFELQSTQVSECADGSWDGAAVVSLADAEVAEITKGDEKPFHVEFVALYEGMSSNERIYSKDAVKSCVDAMIGVNMYKGHIEPGSQSWKYREPVGRIVSAKTETIQIDGKSVLAAKGKAYITESDPKLRADIKRRMAGNVSILGNARMVREYGQSHKTVTKMHKPLKSVDFCNPGTGGLSQAGVTAVVSEMEARTSDPETQTKERKDTNMAKLTKPELLKEYQSEITDLVGEQIGEQVSEMAAASKELAQQKVDFKDQKDTLTAEVAEMKTKLDGSEKEVAEMKTQLKTERDARVKADVTVFATECVAEMQAVDGADENIIKLAAKRVTPTVVEGDLEKSKTAFRTELKSAVEEVTEMATLFGGGKAPSEEDPTKTKTATKNTKGGKKDDMSRFMSPGLAKARKERVGS